jgi:hypothetical protein
MFSVPAVVVSFVFFVLWIINLTTNFFHARKIPSPAVADNGMTPEAMMISEENKNLLNRNVSLWTMALGSILISVAYYFYYLKDDLWSTIPFFYSGVLLLLLGLPGTFRRFFPK